MRIKKLILSICIFILIGSLFPNYSYAENLYIWSDASAIETNSSNDGADLNLESGGAILIEQTTGTVLYEHNAHEMFRPASVTKVMSLLLIMEAIDSRSNFFNW